MSETIKLLDGQTTTVAAGAAKENDGITEREWQGGEILMVLFGTFDGCTVNLEIAAEPAGTFVPPTELSWTAAEAKALNIPGVSSLSCSVASAGASTDVSLYLISR